MSSSQEASQLSKRLNSMDHIRPPIQNNAGGKGRDADKNYAARFDFDPHDKEDRMRELKIQAPVETFGQKFLEKEDLEYIDKKAQQVELEKFDRWYGSIFDHSDPAQLQISKQIYPEWFERRLKAIDETVDFQRSMARINILGITNKEDVLTAYAVASGRIDPSVYNINVMNPGTPDPAITKKQYEYGFYSPYRFEDRTKAVIGVKSATEPLKEGDRATGSGFAVKSVGDLTKLMSGTGASARKAGFLG